MRNKTNNIFLTLLAGILMGTVMGMLFSPTAGAKIRSLIRYQFKNILRKLKTVYKYVDSKGYPQADNTAKIASQTVVATTIHKARQLLAQAEALSDQLDSKNIKS